jgi:hypothetical protein
VDARVGANKHLAWTYMNQCQRQDHSCGKRPQYQCRWMDWVAEAFEEDRTEAAKKGGNENDKDGGNAKVQCILDVR